LDDEIYRDHRIALSKDTRWSARVTHVRGPLAPVSAYASLEEGPNVCVERARWQLDRYLAFLKPNNGEAS
jgi:hypothetical protein